MMDEEGFLIAIADEPADLVSQLVYADWLEERGDERSACLRAWFEVIDIPYSEATYRLLQSTIEVYQSRIEAVDPAWVQRMAKARDWVDEELARDLARLYLRTRHGRKSDRQWIEAPKPSFFDPFWYVSYWRNLPDRRKWNHWRDKRYLKVDRITGAVQEPPNQRPHPSR
jgi:uncharacterized protein (TIGR02996 family)